MSINQRNKAIKRQRVIDAPMLLTNNGISFETKNEGQHLIISICGGYEKINFWPSTGKFSSQNTDFCGVGIDSFIRYYKNKELFYDKQDIYSCWPLDRVQEARRQLNLSNNHEVFMMANGVDSVSDGYQEEIELLFFKQGSLYPEDIIPLMEDNILSIDLPKGFMFVGLHIPEKENTSVYGIVDFSEGKKK